MSGTTGYGRRERSPFDRSAATRCLKRVYNRVVRPHLPRKLGLYNGYVARAPRLFDVVDHVPDYKAELLHAVETTVERGDDVVVVGGGKGIASVVAAEAAGADGQVTTYEAGDDWVEVVEETLLLNVVEGRVEHAIVGTAVAVRGATSAPVVATSDLPDCDVLVLDCDGAEVAVIDGFAADGAPRPREIVVETHAQLGTPARRVNEALADLGYSVSSVYYKPHGIVGNVIEIAARTR
jgi:hypothetical protein